MTARSASRSSASPSIRAAARFLASAPSRPAGERFTARRIVIATGSRPAVPPIPGLADVPYLTNETLFANATLPDHLLILGGGPIGLEMAQAHRRLGSHVTVIEARQPFGQDDPELAAVVLERLAAEGVEISRGSGRHARSPGRRWHSPRRWATAACSPARICSSRPGAQPNVEELGLEAAGIAFTPKGITVDARPEDQQPPGLRGGRRGGRALHP